MGYIHEQEILVVYEMCNKTSTDCNDVSMELVKKSVLEILKPLTAISSQSLNTGVFSDGMKMAKVIAIFKCGKKIVLITTGLYDFCLNVLKS